jgi:hypothetical protein
MAIHSKKKGNSYELVIAKRLSAEFNTEFRRVPNSGAFTGGKNRAKVVDLRADAQEILSGDLIGPKGFPFLVEVKHYADDPMFHKIIQGQDLTLDRWIAQNDGDAAFVDKESLIVFKINRKGEYVVINEESSYVVLDNGELGPYIRYKGKLIMALDTFFKIVDRVAIRGLISASVE